MARKLRDFKQQAMNANRHTERGMKALEASMNEVGYTAPMIAAADGEIIAGSARHETAANVFGADVEPVIIESDGKRPIVVVRTDIKNAETRAAKRIGLLDNRVQEMDLSFDPLVLAQLYAEDETLTAGLWSDDELTEIISDSMESVGDIDSGARVKMEVVPFLVRLDAQTIKTVELAIEKADKATRAEAIFDIFKYYAER
jgi:hypothetical protein